MLLFLVLQICMVLGQQQIANQPGDIFLGGLFPVHKKSDNPRIPCGPIQGQRGIQRLEAMFFTLEEINNKQDLLPNITLGARIIDTCSRNTYAVEQSMDFIRASMHSFSCGQSDAEPVAAVIGGSYSSVSIQVANLLRLFKIPLVSYASTSAVLSDKTRFDYFARTVPPDNFQARAMADIVDYFNWTYVSTVASEGDYGEKGIEAFKDELTARNVCTAIEAKVPQSPNKQNFEKIVKDLIKNEARVVALFLRVEDATQLLSAAQRFNMIDSFVWLASDGWGNNPLPVKDTTNVSRGAITIELKSKKIPDFDTYFRARHPSNNTRNPWFNEFWESAHKCKFKPKENGSLCTGNETFPDFKQDNKLQFVYDTVYAVATALNKVLEEQCWLKEDRKTCMREFLRDGKTFYKHYLLNVSFEGE